jgi:hypothetical protein
MIVKVQRSLGSTGPPSILIYNKDRSLMEQLPLTKEMDKWFGSRFKKFAEARMEGTELVIQNEVPDQSW